MREQFVRGRFKPEARHFLHVFLLPFRKPASVREDERVGHFPTVEHVIELFLANQAVSFETER